MELGEYTLVRRWRWAKAAARVFEARHSATGAPALVMTPRHPEDWEQGRSSWVARVVSQPHMLAVELTHPPRRQDVPEVTLGLYRLATTLAQLEDRPAVQQALGEAAPRAARPVWWVARPAFVAALTAAAVVALVATPQVRAPRGAAAGRAAPGQAAPVPLAVAPDVPEWLVAIGVPMPKSPFEGQIRPKDGRCPKRGMRLINGGCWVALRDVAPPCQEDGYEHEGGCYLPSWPAMKEPRSRMGTGRRMLRQHRRPQVSKAARRKLIDAMAAWWDAEIGERPENLESALGGLLRDVPDDDVWQALKAAADDEQLEHAEDVLERVHKKLRNQRGRKQRKQERKQEPTPKSQRRQMRARLLEWWDANVGSRPMGLEDKLGSLCGELDAGLVMRALKGARAKEERPEGVLERALEDLRDYRRLQRKKAEKANRE